MTQSAVSPVGKQKELYHFHSFSRTPSCFFGLQSLQSHACHRSATSHDAQAIAIHLEDQKDSEKSDEIWIDLWKSQIGRNGQVGEIQLFRPVPHYDLPPNVVTSPRVIKVLSGRNRC